jgi:hypothetical protein
MEKKFLIFLLVSIAFYLLAIFGFGLINIIFSLILSWILVYGLTIGKVSKKKYLKRFIFLTIIFLIIYGILFLYFFSTIDFLGTESYSL